MQLSHGIVFLSAGAPAPVGCTLPYAPPEVVNAWYSGDTITVQPSHDIWSLGVLAFECITQQQMPLVFGNKDAIRACAAGERPYPWEEPEAQQPAAWVRAEARSVLQECLLRDADSRPSAAKLLRALARIGMLSTQTRAP